MNYENFQSTALSLDDVTASSVFLSLIATSSKFSTKSGTSSSSGIFFVDIMSLAIFFSCIKPSGPNCVRIPGNISEICLFSPWPVMANVLVDSDAWVFGLLKCMTLPSFLMMFTSSMPGMVLTESFFKDDCSFLSSVAGVEWTTCNAIQMENLSNDFPGNNN